MQEQTKQAQDRKSTLSLKSLYLDPNNYRFIDSDSYVNVEENDLLRPEIQRRTSALILGKNAENVRDLIDSFCKNGFLPVDQIQVRRVNDTGKFIVVEGNRRIACLKNLQSRFETDGIDLGQLDSDIFSKVPVIYYNDADETHHLVLMGLKHISGNKKWPVINQAELIRTLAKEKQMSPDEICKSIGVSKREITTTLNTLSLIGIYQESDYSDQFESDKYSLFREVMRSRKLRSWLEWDDNLKTAKNNDHLERLFSWISEEECVEDKETSDDLIGNTQKMEAVIVKATQIRELAKIIDDKQALSNLDMTRNLAEATLASEVLGKNKVKNAVSIIGQEINTIFNMSKLVSDSDRTDIQELGNKLKSLLSLEEKQTLSGASRSLYLDTNAVIKFTTLDIQTFRGLRKLKLEELKRINLIAGINNSGKTTLLEALKMLCSMNSPKSFVELIRRRAKIPTDQVDMSWFTEQIPNAKVNAIFNQKNTNLKLVNEQLSVDDMTYYLESACFDLSYGNKRWSSQTHFFEKYPQRTEGDIFSLCPSVFSSPFTGLDPELLNECHSKSLKEGSKQLIVSFIQNHIDADIKNIELDENGQFTVVHDRLSPNPDLTQFGEGLQRIFKIGLLFAGAKNGVVLIDEFENAIHASLLPKVVKLIFELSTKFNAQVFISSHSKECIDAFAKSDILPKEDLAAYSLIDTDGQIECFQFSGDRLHKLVDSIAFDLRGEVNK